ncbi:MAG: hypothetical protein LC792_27450 [Actinobacteria bacterium]|nr:hypothetical protein [Actinomycetota bacterium]
MPAPGQIAGVLLYRGWHLWRWEIYDSVGLWNGYVDVPLAAPLEEASERLAIHIARHWSGQELPGPWEPIGEDLWSAGQPLGAVIPEDDRPQDRTFDWSSVYRAGDVVRLDDGRVAVVRCVIDAGPKPPSFWQLVITATGWWGGPDHFITVPRDCRPAPETREEARREGLL